MSEDVMAWIAIAVIVGAVVVIAVSAMLKQKKYMKNQKETGADKRKVLDVMAEVMKEKLDNYSYAVGNYTKTERYGRTTTYYYFSYILAFNEQELVIFPFVVKDKKLLLRNCVAINWNDVKFFYKIGKASMDMTIDMAGEKLIIIVPKVQSSSGVEKSSEPLGIYQESEVERLISYLPQYKSYCGR